MDQKYNTSFIPKKFLSEDVQGGSTSKYIKHRSIVGPGYFLAVLIFIATVGAAIALFTYTKVTENSINKKMETLKAQMLEVKSEDLTEFLELERQMTNAKMLLDKHVAISEVLHKLEEKTLRDVRYGAMDYRAGEETPSLTLGGETRALSSVALQIREFENEKLLVSPALTRLERDSERGVLSFDIKTGIMHELISYSIAVKEGRHGKAPVPELQPRPISTPVATTTATAPTTPQ